MTLSFTFVCCTAVAAAQYTVTVLPPPAGTLDDQNTAVIPAFTSPINNRGQVAGVVRRPGVADIPVVWTNGVPTVLTVPAGYIVLRLSAINDAGQVVGQIQEVPDPASNSSRVAIWNGTAPTIIPHDFDLGDCPAPTPTLSISNAFGINRAGHVSGQTVARVGNSVCSVLGWIWNGSAFSSPLIQPGPTCLGLGAGGVAIQPFGINDADHVVTSLYDPYLSPCNKRVAILVPGMPIAPLAVPDGYVFGGGTGNQINNLDQTYGNGPDGTAFFWTGSSYVNAVTPPTAANFLSVNNLGQALLLTNGAVKFAIWHNGTSTPIPAIPPAIGYGSPAGINDAGQIASYAAVTLSGFGAVSRIVLLTPSGGCAADVSAGVTVTRGGFRLNRANGHYTQAVTVTNNNSAAIGGPVSVVFDSVPNSATLYGLSGATGCAAPVGSPFITIPSGLAANGGSASVTLDFINTSNSAVTYSTRVLAGSGTR